jgi:hypothetical protein
MRRLAKLTFAVLVGSVVHVGSAFLSAQSKVSGSNANPTSTAGSDQVVTQTLSRDISQSGYLLVGSVSGRACPVSMYAKQRGGGDLLNARDNRPGESMQRIHLVLGNTEGLAKIVGIEVSVYGTSGKNRAVPTLVARNPLLDAAKTFNLPVDIGENQQASANLVLRGFTSVQSISLESVTYADGSTWNSSGSRSCRISPDLLMLVSGR